VRKARRSDGTGSGRASISLRRSPRNKSTSPNGDISAVRTEEPEQPSSEANLEFDPDEETRISEDGWREEDGDAQDEPEEESEEEPAEPEEPDEELENETDLPPQPPSDAAEVVEEVPDEVNLEEETEVIVPEEPEEEVGEAEANAEPEPEEAEEIGANEAAQALGRRQSLRSSTSRASPELGSSLIEPEGKTSQVQESPKRRRGRPAQSPAVQKQPTRRTKEAPAKTTTKASATKATGVTPGKTTNVPTTTKAKPAKKTGETRKRRRESDDGDNPSIEITVQSFVHARKGGDDGLLDGGDPFANRGGETAVDVFAQVCEEVIASFMARLEQHEQTATEAAKKKESRIKMRAIEAYREELSSRLLEHVSSRFALVAAPS
jgi:hypothetical protein